MSEYYYNSPFEFIDDECGDISALPPEIEFIPEICTMEDYYYDHLERVYREFVSRCVREKKVGLNRRTAAVPSPERAEVVDMTMKRLECSRIEGSSTAFNMDAVLVADIIIYQRQSGIVRRGGAYADACRELRQDQVKQWYRVRGTFDINGGAYDLCREISIYERKDALKDSPLSTSLIPILSRSQFDTETAKLLRKYKMDDCLDKPGKVDGFRLAFNMHLPVIKARMSLDYHIKGKLYPFERDIIVYDDYGKEHSLHVLAGTIVVDPVACVDEDGLQDAVIHECVHFEHHSLFYRLQSLYNEKLEYLAFIDNRYSNYLTEDVYEQRLGDENLYEVARKLPNGKFEPKSGHEWAEWQAVNMTPYIRMPAEQTKIKIRQLYKVHSDLRKAGANSAGVAAAVIKDLAKFYGTSIQTARSRMIDLGYHVARGAMVVVDGTVIPPFMTSNGRMAAGISYVISNENISRLFAENDEFRKEMETRPYIYVEHHLCLDAPRFVERTDDGFRLTDYARSHIDECCLPFTIVKVEQHAGYDKNAAHNDEIRRDVMAMTLAPIPYDTLVEFSKYVDEYSKKLPRRFGETLKYHREQAGMTQEELAWQAGMGDKHIRRLENDEVDRPTQQVIAELGRALMLPGSFIEDMMNKAGCPLNRDLPEDMHLKTVIYYMYMRPREECNSLLEMYDCKPLGGRKKKAAVAI